MKKIIKKTLNLSGLSISKVRKERLISENVFNTSFKKTALLSYIQDAFEKKLHETDRRHTNVLTTFIIGDTLKNLGYNVDVIDWRTHISSDFNKYSLVIGLGESLEHILKNRPENLFPKVIWFGTGCNPFFSNQITLERAKNFYVKNKKILLSSTRYVEKDWPLQHEFSDWIILHGADFSKSTFRKDSITTINGPVFTPHYIIKNDEEIIKSKPSFLWLGGGGALHKGLDLLIDAFKKTPQYTLHICGNIQSESDFYAHYYNDLKGNIINHGFIDIQSSEFANILKATSFVIFPSCSEGNCPSVITCMANGGLIPIVTKNADINIEDYGIEIENFSVDLVLKAINKSQTLSLDELKIRREKIFLNTRKKHSFDFFKTDFKIKLESALTSIHNQSSL